MVTPPLEVQASLGNLMMFRGFNNRPPNSNNNDDDDDDDYINMLSGSHIT